MTLLDANQGGTRPSRGIENRHSRYSLARPFKFGELHMCNRPASCGSPPGDHDAWAKASVAPVDGWLDQRPTRRKPCVTFGGNQPRVKQTPCGVEDGLSYGLLVQSTAVALTDTAFYTQVTTIAFGTARLASAHAGPRSARASAPVDVASAAFELVTPVGVLATKLARRGAPRAIPPPPPSEGPRR